MLALLACLAAILVSSVSGCSRSEGNTELSPEARARAKEIVKKKFEDHGRKKGVRASR
jgi:hypothetical protein